MVKVSLYKNNNNDCIGARLEGHAEYADPGLDIVCSAVSMLVINALNSIEALTDDDYICDMDPESGLIDFKISNETDPTHDSLLILRSLMLGLRTVEEEYGKEFILTDF